MPPSHDVVLQHMRHQAQGSQKLQLLLWQALQSPYCYLARYSLVLMGPAIFQSRPEDQLEATTASTTSFVCFSGPLQQTDFNSTHVEQYKVEHFPFPVWRDEAMHELLMRMARSGAEIITQARNSSQPPGNVMRSMIRVDVVLTQQAGQVSALYRDLAVA